MTDLLTTTNIGSLLNLSSKSLNQSSQSLSMSRRIQPFCPVSNTKISLSGYLPRTRLITKLLMILQCRRREKVYHTRSNWVTKMLQSIESSHHCRTSRRSIYLCRSTSMTPSMTDGNGKMPLIGANINSSCEN